MILASDIFTSIRSTLDDDNSGRYSETDDLAPVVNSAIRYLVQVFNLAFEQKKFAPESLRELVRVKILPVTGTGNIKKVNITLGELNFWSIFGIEPDPGLVDNFTTFAPDATIEFTDYAYADADLIETRHKFADRLTLEEWNEKSEDPFSAGSLISVPSTFARAAYLGPGRYFNATDDFILIRPASLFINNYVAIWHLVNPTVVVDGTSQIEFPQSLFNLVVDKSINYLSRQQGPESKIGPITDKDVTQILSLITS